MSTNCDEYIDRHDQTGEFDCESSLQKAAREIEAKRQAGEYTIRQECMDAMDRAIARSGRS